MAALRWRLPRSSSSAALRSRAPAEDEAARYSATVQLPSALPPVAVTEGRIPGRPVVLIDAGHGGSDPGAPSVSGEIAEKQLTLQLARELRDRLASEAGSASR